MSKFLTEQQISKKLLGYALVIGTNDYLTKSQVVSQFSNEDYDETKLNNVKGDNYFVTDDDIVQSPRYALHVTLDTHVQSVKILVGQGLIPTSDNTSDDNDVSPSSLSGDTTIDGPTIGGGTIIDDPTISVNSFIKIGQKKEISVDSTVYIPAGASVTFSATYDDGYEGGEIIRNIGYMTSERTVEFTSVEITTRHTHGNSGTVHVTFNRRNTKDTLSYQVYHMYNNSTCTIQTGDINGTSATITTPTYKNTSILFIPTTAISTSYKMRVDSSSNVTATAFQSGGSSTEAQLVGPLLDLKNIKPSWSVNITIYY